MDKSVRKYLVILLFIVLFLSFTVPGSTAEALGCYTLATAVSPAASGTVNVTESTDCVNGATPGYTTGSIVHLSATPASTYIFSYWTGVTPASSNAVTLTMNTNKSVTAFFRKQVVLNTPSGAITIAGWDNKFKFDPTTGVNYYNIEVQRDTTTIYAKAFQGSSFCTSILCTYFVTDEAQFPILTDGTYRWRIQSTVGGIGIWSDYKDFTLNRGTVVQVAPLGEVLSWDKSFKFTGLAGVGWYKIRVKKGGTEIINRWVQAGGSPPLCVGTDCTFIPTVTEQAKFITGLDYDWQIQYRTPLANVNGPWTIWRRMLLKTPPPCYSLNTSTNNVLYGSVVVNTNPNCGVKYYSGTSVSITGNPLSGYQFSNWTGSNTGYTNPLIVSMTGNKTITGNFRSLIQLVSPLSPPILTTWDNSYSWLGVMGGNYYNTWYHVEVQNLAGTITYLNHEYMSTLIVNGMVVPVCDIAENCRVVPYGAVILPNGDFRWRVHDESLETGPGPWTAYGYFTLNR